MRTTFQSRRPPLLAVQHDVAGAKAPAWSEDQAVDEALKV
jgi:hypothetical protein